MTMIMTMIHVDLALFLYSDGGADGLGLDPDLDLGLYDIHLLPRRRYSFVDCCTYD